MKSDISEFSYGFVLTAEIMERFPHLRQAGAPEFLSLQEEGTQGGGYDVGIAAALFLQFKLTEVLTRSTANEANLLGVPYFRMRLRPLRHSAQHQLLLQLEEPDHLVFYCAPAFSTPEELNDAYINHQAMERSVFFRPSAIGSLDTADHYVVFHGPESTAYLRSEKPQSITLTTATSFMEEVRTRSTAADLARTKRDFLLRLVEQMWLIHSRVKSRPAETQIKASALTERELAIHAQYLSRTLFDCELLIVLTGGAEEGRPSR